MNLCIFLEKNNSVTIFFTQIFLSTNLFLEFHACKKLSPDFDALLMT